MYVTCSLVFQRTLMLGIYQMLDLCDKHSQAQLHVVLDSGAKQIFAALYQDFETFHKYNSKA